MGTMERVEILNEKYMAQEDFNDLLKNAKVSVFSYFRTDVGSTTLYTQKYVDEKDKTINELLKRISELEFEVERYEKMIDTLEKHLLEVYENWKDSEVNYEIAMQSMYIYNFIQELKGDKK